MNTTLQHKHTNRLIDSTSPYLLQHAHNPVDWYPWGEQALSRAKSEDKPIFLSIGYAACHWCHVMEHECFENEEIAAFLNRHFVCIKVDREERPDLDEVYMTATQIFTGSGGWPMSVFLAPDLRPFYAGTYFPPTSRYGRPGFMDLLKEINTVWQNDRDRLLQNADAITERLEAFTTIHPGSEVIPLDSVRQVASTIAGSFDRSRGGIDSGPSGNKFPPSMTMELMLRVYQRSVAEGQPRKDLLDLVELTLRQMANGGICDQLGGGIHRYSTDPQWLVPHFEKMLYDQALVAWIYLSAYQITGKEFYADVARGILDYCLGDLQSPEGGFYSTRDADSEGVEGKYYVWSRAEVEAVLGAEDAKLFCRYYDVSDVGNWEGRNILHVPHDAETVAKMHGVTADELRDRLAACRQKLLAVRDKRIPPGLDDKILTSWNGLLIATLARGASVLDEDCYRRAAVRAADFILTTMRRDGRLLRAYRNGKAHIGGYLSDYAFLIDGLIELYQTTFDAKWLTAAEELNEQVVKRFLDRQEGGFFYVSDDAEQLIVRTKDPGDTALPSGNSVQLMNLLRLAILQDQPEWRRLAEQTMKAFAGRLSQSPGGFDRFCWAVAFYHSQPKEIVIVGDPTDSATRELCRAVYGRYLPNKIVAGITSSSQDIGIPLLKGKTMIGGKPTAYVCQNYACKAPVTTAKDLAVQLAAD